MMKFQAPPQCGAFSCQQRKSKCHPLSVIIRSTAHGAHGSAANETQLRIKQMAEPTSMVVPLAIAGVGGGVAIAAGVDSNAVVMAFAGAAMFSFVSRGTVIPVRVGLLLSAWIFGYYAGLEIVQRGIWGFKSPPVPSFVAAFFCVAVFKALLAIFNEDGKAWIRKKLGLSTEGPKDE